MLGQAAGLAFKYQTEVEVPGTDKHTLAHDDMELTMNIDNVGHMY